MPDDYIEEALILLRNHRHTQHKESPASASSKHPFSYEEVNQVLTEVLYHDTPILGLVQALLEMGADINYARRKDSSVWKKMVGRTHKAKRATFLQRAAARSTAEVVAVLAPYADQKTLDAAMVQAQLRGDADVVRVLLDHGADPEGLDPGLRQRYGGSGHEGWEAEEEEHDWWPEQVVPPPKEIHADESWHQEQLDRVMMRRGYKSMDDIGAAARADQERLRMKIAELQCKNSMRASTARSQSSAGQGGEQLVAARQAVDGPGAIEQWRPST